MTKKTILDFPQECWVLNNRKEMCVQLLKFITTGGDYEKMSFTKRKRKKKERN